MAVGWPAIEKALSHLKRERGTIGKDWGGKLPVALVYPNSYFVGMSNLGFQTVYRLLNSYESVVCERVFLNLGRGTSELEVLSLESQRSLQDFAVIAFSISFELDYINVVRILREARIPLLARERDGWPLVIAGGAAVTGNPMPLAPILDAVFIGEMEARVDSLVQELQNYVDGLADLPDLASQDAFYVPSEGKDGQIVRRVWVESIDDWPTATVVVTPFTEFSNMRLVELARGCIHGCRFCLAGHIYRPVRERSVDSAWELAMPAVFGGEIVGLVAPSVSDCRSLRSVLERIVAAGARASVSSLRADSVDRNLLQLLSQAGNNSLTMAPESGCIRLRELIGKHMDAGALVEAASMAQAEGFDEIKLYFMTGLPSETVADVAQVLTLVQGIRSVFRGKTVVNVSCFVPKANTPFQWQAMAPVEDLKARIAVIQNLLRPEGVEVRTESPEWARIQAAFSQGDERIGLALSRCLKWSRSGIEKALINEGIDLEVELAAKSPGQEMPWSFIDSGLPRGYLERRGSGLPQ